MKEMKEKMAEILAVVVTIVGIAGATIWPFFHEAKAVQGRLSSETQVITLTGVASQGVWTGEEVRGANYWNHTFSPARPVLHVEQTTLLRFKSADLTHTFYSPGLGVGPVEVYPGHVVEVPVTPTKEGVFDYYCTTTMCGESHFGMRGEIVVQRDGGPPPPPSSPSIGKYWLAPPPPAGASRVERGKWLYHQKGCFTCHGPEGRGGVRNWNYIKRTVPALNTLAERLMLTDREDAKALLAEMERGVALESLSDSPPIARFNVFLSQYRAIRDVIRKGSSPGKKNPPGPTPPLEMPAWGQKLSDEDINAIIAYLLTMQPWEEEEGERMASVNDPER